MIALSGDIKKVNLSLKQKNILRKALFAVSFAAFLFSSAMIAGRIIDSYKTKNLNAELLKIYEETNSAQTNAVISDNEAEGKSQISENTNVPTAENKGAETDNKVSETQNQIQKLKEINSDVKGWISIENTKISHPVVQTVDNSFYLEHDVSKNKNRYGAIFVDANNDISDPKNFQGQNIVIYGHYMKDGSMFASLKNFRNPVFFKSNDTIKLDLFLKSYKFQVFGVYLVNDDFDYRSASLGTEANIKNLLKRLRSKKVMNRDVTLSPDDTILTLSTCAYDFKDARLVVMAKLIKDEDIKGTSQK